MLQTLKKAWNSKEIRGQILFTLFILLLYRVGTVIPVPFVEANNFAASFSGTILDQLNILSGGALGTATLFALGVSPYINASIIIQLLAVVFPKLGEIAKTDKSKMNFITRITTVILAAVTAFGYYVLLKDNGALTNAATPADNKYYWIYGIVIVACYCAGASVVMWLAERINEKGIGNGISLILFANIISVLPSFFIQLVSLIIDTFSFPKNAWLFATLTILFGLILVAAIVALIIFVIWVTGSERRIPVMYAGQIKGGRKMLQGQKQDLPIKLNMTGVMPIIFASSIVSLVPTILALCGVNSSTKGFWGGVNRILASNGVVYPVLLFVLIIAFTYFYTQITFDPVEVANTIRGRGGLIKGIRQGKPTVDFIKKILNKVTIVGALFLAIIAILPVIAGPHIIQHFLEWVMDNSNYAAQIAEYKAEIASGTLDAWTQYVYQSYISQLQSNMTAIVQSLTSTFTFGGTSLLIMVGVVIETFMQLEAKTTARNTKGIF